MGANKSAQNSSSSVQSKQPPKATKTSVPTVTHPPTPARSVTSSYAKAKISNHTDANGIIGGSSVDVQYGDLNTTKTDVIVVCSSSKILLENVLAAAGDSIRSTFDNGSKDSLISIVTNGQLPCKQIYALPWNKGSTDDEITNSLKVFVAKVVEKAVEDKYQSIAIPAIGCGLNQCSNTLVANAMTAEAHHQATKHSISISFIIQPGRTNIFDEFQKHLSALPPLLPSRAPKRACTTIGKSTLEVNMGNLLREKADVIAVSKSSNILRQAILKAAGPDITSAYDTQHSQNSNALIIVTGPGKLPCRAIFFLQWTPDPNETVLRQSITDFIGSVIQNALSHQYTSIAFPAVGCGKHACSVDVVVETMVEEVKTQIRRRNLSLNIKYVIEPTQQNVYDEFCKHVLTSNELEPLSLDALLPLQWVPSPKSQLRHEVLPTSDEYKSVLSEFLQSMHCVKAEIVRIERIQNERWYKQYIIHKEDFKERLQQDTERRLYHGCPEEAAKSIIEDCFNRSFAGKNGTSYGMGVYFSAQASYSYTYSHPNSNGERFMFVASVLIGKTTPGNSSMKTRPIGFDSTTNGNHIFVTYHDAQAYAEYLITFK